MKDVIATILESNRMVFSALEAVRKIDLNDCWIGAGFIRNTIWDHLHGIKDEINHSDVDVVFYDGNETSLEYEIELKNVLSNLDSSLPWSVKNQARMRQKYHHDYSSTLEAISFWPETATCIAARLSSNNTVELIAPYGYDDLLNLILRPSPKVDPTIFYSRVKEKEWLEKWPKLKII
jgi:hypothetical protein